MLVVQYMDRLGRVLDMVYQMLVVGLAVAVDVLDFGGYSYNVELQKQLHYIVFRGK